MLDAETGINFGRPFLILHPDAGCDLPSDDHEVAALSGSCFSSLSHNVTWLSSNTYHIKLTVAARSIYAAFYSRYADVFDDENAWVREASAIFLVEQMKSLDSWVHDLPDALKIRRRDGRPLSTDRSPLDVEQFAPSWVQHQRLTLELLYHNICVTLWRPYVLCGCVYGSAAGKDRSVIAESCARNCANHAVALTHMLRQVLTTTDILAGWYDAFQWQWNCAMTLAGFALTHVGESLVREVDDALGAAIEVLGIFGKSFAAGVSAANVIRRLKGIANLAPAQDDAESFGLAPMRLLQTEQAERLVCEYTSTAVLGLDEEAIAAVQEMLSGATDFDIPWNSGDNIFHM